MHSPGTEQYIQLRRDANLSLCLEVASPSGQLQRPAQDASRFGVRLWPAAHRAQQHRRKALFLAVCIAFLSAQALQNIRQFVIGLRVCQKVDMPHVAC